MPDDLGDRMKFYEAVETDRRFLPMLPIYARIDGRGFSRFTKGMTRPYDVRMTDAMIQTTVDLVGELQADCGYVQSDEISLVWYFPEFKSEMQFDRKVQKLVSVAASSAAASFGVALLDKFEDGLQRLRRKPHFDCRVIQLPNLTEAANMMLWRNNDATKNAVAMAAHSMFSAKSLHGLGSAAMQERMFQENNVNFNDYPEFFKRGTFVRRVTTERCLTEDELARIPAAKRPAPGQLFTRSKVQPVEVPRFSAVINRVGFLFQGEDPQVALASVPEQNSEAA